MLSPQVKDTSYFTQWRWGFPVIRVVWFWNQLSQGRSGSESISLIKQLFMPQSNNQAADTLCNTQLLMILFCAYSTCLTCIACRCLPLKAKRCFQIWPALSCVLSVTFQSISQMAKWFPAALKQTGELALIFWSPLIFSVWKLASSTVKTTCYEPFTSFSRWKATRNERAEIPDLFPWHWFSEEEQADSQNIGKLLAVQQNPCTSIAE